jgi:hypothetical protein
VKDVEAVVQEEVLAALKPQKVEARKSALEKNNRETILAETGEARRKIGTLVSTTIHEKINSKIRFKLNGVQTKDPRDAIDKRQISEMVKKAVAEKMRKGLFRKFR